MVDGCALKCAWIALLCNFFKFGKPSNKELSFAPELLEMIAEMKVKR